MQRPTRILVFGILGLLVGALSGFSNLGELQLAIVGPAGVEVPDTAGMGQMGEMLRSVTLATQSALGKPVYRSLFGIEAAMSCLMAIVLITGSIGLLRDRLWSLRLLKAWGFYAIVASVFTVVLQARFVMPQAANMPPGSGALSAACMLPVFWLFPVLLLTLLGRPAVTDYLNSRSSVANAGPARLYDEPLPPRPMARPTQEPSRSATGTGSAASPKEQTWRDDPWNDPGSR